MPVRTLVLRKEALTEIGPEDLRLVGGAATSPPVGCVADLVSDRLQCDSWLRPCITHTCTL